MTLRIRLLGGFAVDDGGREIPAAAFGGQLTRRLVRMLASRRGELAPRDVLVAGLWPRDQPADPAGNLNALVSRARRALGSPQAIRTGQGGYALGDACSVDAEAFLSAVDAARTHAASERHAAARSCYDDALRQWTGEPLIEDRYADWARGYRQMLDDAHVAALEGAADVALRTRDAAAAADLAGRAVVAAPLREPTHALLIRALAAAGDRAAALAAYDRLRRLLADELGLDPAPATVALQTALLRGEPVPNHSGQTGRSREQTHHRMSSPLGGVGDSSASTRSVHTSVQEPRAPAAELAFVGRDRELERLCAWDGDTHPNVAVIAGRSGSGKSRLLAEAAARLGQPTVAARAYLGERDEPWSLARSLVREALAAFPDAVDAIPHRARPLLGDMVGAPDVPVDADPVDAESARALRREACLRLLTARAHEAVLAVDDLQWADATSLQLLRSLIGRDAYAVVLLAFRIDEAADDDPLGRLLADLDATVRPRHVAVPPLSADAVTDLIRSPDLAAVVAADTDRTPYVVAELLHTLAGRELAGPDDVGRWQATDRRAADLARTVAAEGQAQVVLGRIRRHPPGRRRVLALLALLARATPSWLLAEAAGAPIDATLDALGHLTAAGLVRSHGTSWTTAHDLVGETVRTHLDPTERVRLHAAIAWALADNDGDLAEVALHRERSGDPAAAATYADAARTQLAHHAVTEAGALIEAGLHLASPEATRSTLLELRAELRTRLGDLHGARDDLRAALRDRAGSPQRARLLARMALAASGAQDMLHAAELAQLALVEAGTAADARARALSVAAIIDMNIGESTRADERAAEALTLFERLGDSAGVADVLDGRAMAAFLDGRIRDALDAFDRVAELFTDAGELLRVVTPRSTRGHGLVFAGRPADALEETEAAVELAEQLGHREGQTYALWHRAEALAALGRSDPAIASAERALEIARRMGHRGWTATALRALGIAHVAAGDHDAAARAFRDSLEVAVHLPLFASWAAARLALVHLARGEVAAAAPLVARALKNAPPLGQFEARLANAELAAARADPTAAQIAGDALRIAEDRGYLDGTRRLRALSDAR